VSIAKYSIVFYGDPHAAAPAADKNPAPRENTQASAQEPQLPQQKTTPKACLEVLENPAGQVTEFALTELSSYIGKSAQANIPYKSRGIFGGGPEMAAVITMRPEGYYITPVKEGYAKHNGDVLTGKLLLADDDIIEVGATRFRFLLKKP